MEFPLHPSMDACIQCKESPRLMPPQTATGKAEGWPCVLATELIIQGDCSACAFPAEQHGQVGLDTLKAPMGYATGVIGNEGEVNKMIAQKQSRKFG
jgi:hypothetical protein